MSTTRGRKPRCSLQQKLYFPTFIVDLGYFALSITKMVSQPLDRSLLTIIKTIIKVTIGYLPSIPTTGFADVPQMTHHFSI
jgi:hypothetical protein